MAVDQEIDEFEAIDESIDRRRTHHAAPPRPHTTPILIGALVAVVAGVFIIDAVRSPGTTSPGAAATPAVTQPATTAAAATSPAATTPAAAAAAQIDDTTPVADVDVDGCMLDTTSVGAGASGPNVECVQKALTAAGFYSGPIDGVYSPALASSATQFQTATGLYVDGVVGRRTATLLGIWPGDDSFVIHTPPPAPGTKDSLGSALSGVASTGADAPPLPPTPGREPASASSTPRRATRVGDRRQREHRAVVPRVRQPVQQRGAR